MNDKELLEMAAKAAAYYVVGWIGDCLKIKDIGPLANHHDPFAWNPLKNDGDALRLAVKLGIN